MQYNQSFEDINIEIMNKNNKINKNTIFREYIKKNESFVAINKFFISHEIDNGMIEFRMCDVNSINEKITPFLHDENIYISMKDSRKISIMQ